MKIVANEELFNRWKNFETRHMMFGFSGIVQNEMELTEDQLKLWIIESRNRIKDKLSTITSEFIALSEETVSYIENCNK